MSTRGAVAWLENGEWIGVYNHYDSYPTNLGVEVYEKATSLGAENMVNLLKGYGDWRELINGGVCEYCGKVAGQPHSISGEIILGKNLPQPPDPDAKHHEHGDGKSDQFDPRIDPLFMEWVYLILPNKNEMIIWKSLPNKERRTGQAWTGKVDESGYTHVAVKVLPLNKTAEAFSWDSIEHSRFKRLSLVEYGL
jgi:hypothetical protein